MTSKTVSINGVEWNTDYLIEQIKLAQEQIWTPVHVVADHWECVICGQPFMPNDVSLKYHAGGPDSRGWLDTYCYNRFIAEDGLPGLLAEIENIK